MPLIRSDREARNVGDAAARIGNKALTGSMPAVSSEEPDIASFGLATM